jgi:hypothetical protein
MAFGKTIKKAYMKAKKKAYGSRGVKGRYYRVGAVQGLKNLAKDIEMIKGRLNVEKKHKEIDVISAAIGQCDANGDRALAFDVTPSIGQGLGSDDRVGNSLKMTGMTFPMSFTQQGTCLGDRKVRITLLRVRAPDSLVSTGTALTQVWDVNPLNGLRDFDAPRAYRNSKTDGITVLRSITCYIKGPQLDNGTPGVFDYEKNVKNLRLNVKLDDVLRYSSDVTLVPDGIRYVLVFQCNAGNVSFGSSSTLDVPVKSTNSGLDLRLGQRAWWVDN